MLTKSFEANKRKKLSEMTHMKKGAGRLPAPFADEDASGLLLGCYIDVHRLAGDADRDGCERDLA